MRILFISNDALEESPIRKQLSELSEKDSIAFCYTFDNAKYFISNNLEKNQETIDLIISYHKVYYQTSDDFRDWLRNVREKPRVYSNRNFNLDTIPIFLIAEYEENVNAFRGYNAVVNDLGVEKIKLFQPKIIKVVKTWRRSVLDEMDNLGIRFNSGVVDYSYYFSSKRGGKVDTRILSENFKTFPRKLRACLKM